MAKEEKFSKLQITLIVAFAVSALVATSVLIFAETPQLPPDDSPYRDTETVTYTTKSPIVTTKITEAAGETVRFPIDINIAKKDELMQLSGIGETLADRIISYRSGGNYFYYIEDLKKVLGIGQSVLDKNEGKIIVNTGDLPTPKKEKTPTIPTIPAAVTESETSAELTIIGIEILSDADDDMTESREELPNFPLEINSCSEEDLQYIKGIGPVTARNIIAYRVEKGGFYAIEDLMKVSGIGPASFEKIRGYVYVDASWLPPREDFEEDTKPSKTSKTTEAIPISPINLNTATASELAALPGINEAMAQKIVEFRESVKNGAFSSLEELLYVDGFTKSAFNKACEYLFL